MHSAILRTMVLVTMMVVLAAASLAWAQGTAPTVDSAPGEIIDRAVGAGQDGDIDAALLLVGMAAVALVRQLVGAVKRSRLLSWIVNFAVAWFLFASIAVAGEASITWRVAINAVVAALTAAGGWQLAKDAGVVKKKAAATAPAAGG